MKSSLKQLLKNLARLSLFGLLAACGLLGISGCSTEVETNAPGPDSPVMYMIVNPDSAYQYLRLNKSFKNADGRNAFDIAKNDPDRYSYPKNQWAIELIEVDRQSSRVLCSFESIENNNKSLEGDFSAPAQLLYRSTVPVVVRGAVVGAGFKRKLTYRLVARNLISGDTFSGQTQGIEPVDLGFPSSTDLNSVQTYTFATNPKGPNSAFIIVLNSPVDKNATKSNLEVNYTEYHKNGDSLNKICLIRGVASLTNDISGEEFFSGILQNIKVDNNVDRREFRKSRVVVYFANSDFSNYLDVLNNYNPVTQIRPTYNNLNGAVGLIAFRRSSFGYFSVSNETVSQMNLIQGNNFLRPDLAALNFRIRQ
jgi:hypothetical protein